MHRYCKSFKIRPRPPMVQQPLVGQGPQNIEPSRSHSVKHYTRQDSSGREISPTQTSAFTRQISMPQRNSNTQTQQASGHRPTA